MQQLLLILLLCVIFCFKFSEPKRHHKIALSRRHLVKNPSITIEPEPPDAGTIMPEENEETTPTRDQGKKSTGIEETHTDADRNTSTNEYPKGNDDENSVNAESELANSGVSCHSNW